MATAVAAGLATCFSLSLRDVEGNPGKRIAYRFCLFASAALAGATGFFGGALVHGIDRYAW